MSAFCNSSTDTGHACGYPPNACPSHTPISSDILVTSPGEPPAGKFDRNSLASIAESVITSLHAGALKPLDAIRWLRALHTFYQLPVSEISDEDAWKEVELRGRIMHGQAPRDAEEWARAERVFDDEALAMFHQWEAKDRGWDDPDDASNAEGHDP